MIKTVSKKTYICFLCKGERKGNASSHRIIFCGRCVSRLLNTPLEKISQLIATIDEQKGKEEVAKLLEHFLDWDQVTERRRKVEEEWELKKKEVEDEEDGRTMDGRRLDREVSFAKAKQKKRKRRQKQHNQRLDSQRIKIYRNLRHKVVSGRRCR